MKKLTALGVSVMPILLRLQYASGLKLVSSGRGWVYYILSSELP